MSAVQKTPSEHARSVKDKAKDSAHWLFDCHFLGNHAFGQDVDYLLCYETPKVVRICDRRLGVIRYLIVLAILCYIFVSQIWSGAHLKEVEMEGVNRLQWQLPTLNGCDPMRVECKTDFDHAEDLPYCTEYAPKSRAASGYPASQQPCDYRDSWNLPVELPAGVLIPTYVEQYAQNRTCESRSRRCESKFAFVAQDGKFQEGEGKATPISKSYIAGAEDFTVLIDHAFSTQKGRMTQNDNEMHGYWIDCRKGQDACEKRKILPVGESFKVNAKLWALGEAPPKVFGLSDGDVFSLRTLMAMAAGSPDLPPHRSGNFSLDDVVDEHSNTRRLRGTAIMVQIQYFNSANFFPRNRPWYEISVILKPMTEFKQVRIADQGPDGRQLFKEYGILLLVQQGGRICVFNFLNSMLVITAAFSLLTMSKIVTEFLALYFLKQKEVYGKLKYEESADFHTVQDKMEERDSMEKAKTLRDSEDIYDSRPEMENRRSQGDGPRGVRIAETPEEEALRPLVQ